MSQTPAPQSRTTAPQGEPGSALVIGEALIDVVVDGSSVAEHPGGSPMNVAIGLARLGRRVELATWYGTDEHGGAIDAHLERDGVIVQEQSRQAVRTATATATLAADGQATYSFDLEWALPRAALTQDHVVVHSGSIASVLAPGRDAVLAALGAAGHRATVTYDPNIRPDLLGDPARGRRLVEECVRLADVVKASDEDLAWLGEGADPEEVQRGWLSLGPRIVVMTRGGQGVVAMTSDGLEVRVPAAHVNVVDTVGAGDSFMSGLIDGLWSAGLLGAEHRDELGRIDGATLRAVLERCTRIAGITVSRAGANPPTLAELG